MSLTFGSLFAGIGGFDLGFERAGMRCVWQVERDAACLKTLAKHWPDVRRLNDVRAARAYAEPKHAGRVHAGGLVRPDIVCGGFPCQDLSVAGKRAGLAGGRSGLFWVARRIVSILKPTWIVLENVPGLLSSNKGRDMRTVVNALVASGYGVAWRVLDSQYFGLAQRRKRVFLVGCLGDVRRAAEVLFERESCVGDTPPSRKAGKAVANALTDRLDRGGGNSEGQRLIVAFGGGNPGSIDIATACNAHGSGRLDFESETFVTHTLRGEGFDASEDGTGRGTPLVPSRAGVRRLTPTECERLQGFPDGWTAGQPDSTRYRQLGNAVSVPVAEWIGRRIVEVALSK